MAVSTYTFPTLEWRSLDGGPRNLFARFMLDFEVYDTIIIPVSAPYRNSGAPLIRAVSGVIDNLDGAGFIRLDTAGFIERVAPFSKSPFIVFSDQPVRVMGQTGRACVALFSGLLPGAPYGLNPLGARAPI